MTVTESSFALVFVISGARTIVSILYLGVVSKIVMPGVLGSDFTLVASIWRTGAWFIVAVACSHSVWLVVMDADMSGLIYCGVRSETVAPGVSCCNIALAVSTWRTGPWFIVEVAWINIL